VVQPIAYDVYGRENIRYLPYVSSGTNGWYNNKPTDNAGSYAGSAQFNFYNGGSNVVARDSMPYAVTTFEPSPLNRTIKQGFVGKVGQPNATNTYASTDHTLKKAYQLNGSNEVLKWTFTGPASGNPLGLVNAGTASSKTYYVANTLSRKKTKDENGNEVIQYETWKGMLF